MKCPNCGFVQPEPPKKPQLQMNNMLAVCGLGFFIIYWIVEHITTNEKAMVGIATAIAIPLAVCYGIGKYRYDKRKFEERDKGKDCG